MNSQPGKARSEFTPKFHRFKRLSPAPVAPGVTGLLLLASALAARAAIYNAASAHDYDIAAALTNNPVADGDTVNVPAGTVTWTNGITVSKAIALSAAGTNATVIDFHLAGATVQFASGVNSNSEVRLTGFGFTGQTNLAFVPHQIAIYAAGSGPSGPGVPWNGGPGIPLNALRIDHCAFTGGLATVTTAGWVYGVIDHCTFHLSNIAVYSQGDDDAGWSRAVSIGTTNALYVETCSFDIADINHDALVYAFEGARIATRFSAFTSYAVGDNGLLDSHGNLNYYSGTTSDQRGTVQTEIYGNSFSFASNPNRLAYLRGGVLIVNSNSVSQPSGQVAVANVTEEEDWYSGFGPAGPPWGPPSNIRNTWPAQDQVTNSFFWANSGVGAVVLNNAADLLVVNRDWWTQSPNATNGSPAGIYAAYTPLVYPHPLVSAGNAGTNTVPIVIQIGPLKYSGNVKLQIH